MGTAIGAAFAGNLAVTGSSGPGIALKSESISLAFMMELPLIVINVQRGGPSTGLPTKPEQSDLLFSLYGRHGESPIPVIAAASPSDAFEMAIEAARLALKYMTPVLLLSDNQIANGSEPWKLPDVDSLEPIPVRVRQVRQRARRRSSSPTCATSTPSPAPGRSPARPGLEHRVGGLEKEAITGNVSYEPANHQLMTDTRAWKVANIANDIPPVEVNGETDAEILVLGWGSTYGSIRAAARRVRLAGKKVATAHLRYLNPLPTNLGEVLQFLQTDPDPRAEHRSASEGDQVRVPARRQGPEQGGRRAVQGRGNRREDPGDDQVTAPTYTRADFQTDQEVRWCPGCGDYTILASVQQFLAGLSRPREEFVFVSGIGCASRFPYYMNTYGMHSIHGRAPAIASGVATSRPDLSVWVITGDGDGLSIGGNHLIHALRRNINLKILLFNNQIYGLTKGQYSPTSELGKQTKSTPFGSIDYPFNPVSLALGAEATFVARTLDMDRTPHRGHPPRRVRARRLGIRRDLSELQRVQRQGVHPIDRQGGTGPQPDRPRAGQADRLRRRRQGRGVAQWAGDGGRQLIGGPGRDPGPRPDPTRSLDRVHPQPALTRPIRAHAARDLPQRETAHLRVADERSNRHGQGEGRRRGPVQADRQPWHLDRQGPKLQRRLSTVH